MIIYNVTTILQEHIEQDYLNYMKEIHMPEVMASGTFSSCNLLKLTEPDNEGATYCAQYITDDIKKLNEYRVTISPKLQEDFQQKFENQYVAFRSILQSV